MEFKLRRGFRSHKLPKEGVFGKMTKKFGPMGGVGVLTPLFPPPSWVTPLGAEIKL